VGKILFDYYRGVGLRKENTMKRVDLSVSHLSLAQKLDLMETLWADLSRDEKALKSPAWHENVLKDREEAFAAGKATVSDWEQAKKRIKKKVS
jgi:hypothetical protein